MCEDGSRPVAISVSTNFSDILPYSIDYNLNFFDHWYIVTDQNDKETIRVIEERNQGKITVIFYNFVGTTIPHTNGSMTKAIFDKGGAIRAAQERAYKEYPNRWYLVLDTDIVIRSHRDIATTDLDKSSIYGPVARCDYRSLEDFRKCRVDYKRPMNLEDPPIIGFFQLYASPFLYHWSEKTDLCDVNFTNIWTKEQQKLLSFTVDHLGYWAPEVPNTHHGRILGKGFTVN